MLTAKCNTVLDVCAHLSSMSLARTGGGGDETAISALVLERDCFRLKRILS
jgi:hypothetical protein